MACCVQTTFAKGGVRVRGDTSAWTDTPQQKLQRLQQSYEAEAAALPSNANGDSQKPSGSAVLAVEGFNATHRSKTLLEQHQAKLQVYLLGHPQR